MRHFTKALLLSATLATGVVAPAVAQEYPAGTLTAIVPFSPGGTSDALARIYGNALGPMLGGNTVVIDNRPGASGNIGIAAAAASAADGMTLLFTSSAIVWNPALFDHLTFDADKDILPVAILATSPQVIAVNAEKFPTQDLKEVIQYAKDHPGELNLAASGVGLVERLFATLEEIDVAVIPYNGSADTVTAVLAGEADIVMGSALNLVSVIETGKLRVLAVAGDKRMEVLPEVMTTAELGLPELNISFLFGAFVPGGTPAELVEKLNAALNDITAQPEVIAQIEKLGWSPATKSVAESDATYRAELKRWAEVVEKTGIEKLD